MFADAKTDNPPDADMPLVALRDIPKYGEDGVAPVKKSLACIKYNPLNGTVIDDPSVALWVIVAPRVFSVVVVSNLTFVNDDPLPFP